MVTSSHTQYWPLRTTLTHEIGLQQVTPYRSPIRELCQWHIPSRLNAHYLSHHHRCISKTQNPPWIHVPKYGNHPCLDSPPLIPFLFTVLLFPFGELTMMLSSLPDKDEQLLCVGITLCVTPILMNVLHFCSMNTAFSRTGLNKSHCNFPLDIVETASWCFSCMGFPTSIFHAVIKKMGWPADDSDMEEGTVGVQPAFLDWNCVSLLWPWGAFF